MEVIPETCRVETIGYIYILLHDLFLLAGKCKPDCKHGGVCIGNNKCQCPAAYSGEICKFFL